jgi:hypothetical protein
MGFINSGTTTTLSAKLTPVGRRKLILTNNNLVSTFCLGDSDSNYYAALPLTTGQVPTDSGDVGPYNTISNSVGPDVTIKSQLILNSNGVTKKSVESSSANLTTTYVSNGQVIVSGSYLTQSTVNRNNINTDSLVNLYYAFSLPLNSTDDYTYTGKTYTNGGYSDTGFSAFAQSNIYVIGIDNTKYGEVIDGKVVKVELTTTATTYTLYSSFQNTGIPNNVQDSYYRDESVDAKNFGPNIGIMFSDNIQKPSNISTLSWSTGFGSVKPFSQNGKQLYNLQTNTNLGLTGDTPVGIAYLDNGFVVITNQQIINQGIISSATTVTIDSISTQITQNVTCIAGRGEFGSSTNLTFNSTTDTPRISEIGLYDTDGDLIAIAKPDRHLLKNVNEFLALSIKITV